LVVQFARIVLPALLTEGSTPPMPLVGTRQSGPPAADSSPPSGGPTPEGGDE